MESSSEPRRSSLAKPFIAGCTAGVPAAILLTYLAVLPLFLGLFFFLLLGLLVGALMFRFGRKAAPAPRGRLWLGGTGVVVVMWLTTLVVEYAIFPSLVSQRVGQSWHRRLTAEEKQTVARETRQAVLSRFVGREYRGGPVDWICALGGYTAWVARDGTMQCPRGLNNTTYLLQLDQRRRAWVLRVLLSLGLLEFAVLSQYLGLVKTPKSKTREDGNASEAIGPEDGDKRA
jgi:hypothetical protein